MTAVSGVIFIPDIILTVFNFFMALINYPVRLITIDEDRADQRIDNFLISQFKGVPKSFVYRILRKGEVRVNKKRIDQTYRLAAGDVVRLPPVKIEDNPVVVPSGGLTIVKQLGAAIIHETDEMLVINKPAGIAVHGGSGVEYGVIEALRSCRTDLHYLELVHRLDRETSGCLMIAKKRSALRNLHEQLRNKTVHKHYYALVRGKWSNRVKFVDQPLLKNVLQSGERMVFVSRDGKPSKTLYEIVEEFSGATLVQASPLTGRTHQIRVHCAYATHPIAGDQKYGDRQFDSQISAATGLRRMFLHARSITFNDPATGKATTVTAELDEELQSVLDRLHEQQ